MGYTIVTIEGEGENSEYVRLADDLIRRSAIYQHLCTTNWRSCQLAVRQKNFRLMWKERFKELKVEFREYEKSVNRLLTHQQKEVDRAKTRVKEEQKKYFALRSANNVTIQNLKKGIASSKPLYKYRSIVQQNERFFTQQFSWQNYQQDTLRAEMILRTMIAYEELKVKGELTYAEIMYLSVGIQLKTFTREDIENRFPDFSKWFNRDIKLLLKAGLIQKLYRRQNYYITHAGREKFKTVIGTMYNRPMGTYWKDLFKDLK